MVSSCWTLTLALYVYCTVATLLFLNINIGLNMVLLICGSSCKPFDSNITFRYNLKETCGCWLDQLHRFTRTTDIDCTAYLILSDIVGSLGTHPTGGSRTNRFVCILLYINYYTNFVLYEQWCIIQSEGILRRGVNKITERCYLTRRS